MIDIRQIEGAEQPLEIVIERHGGDERSYEPTTFKVELTPEIDPVGVTLDVSQLYVDGEARSFQSMHGRYIEEYAVKHIVLTPDLDRPSLHVNLVPYGEADQIQLLSAESWDDVKEAFEE